MKDLYLEYCTNHPQAVILISQKRWVQLKKIGRTVSRFYWKPYLAVFVTELGFSVYLLIYK